MNKHFKHLFILMFLILAISFVSAEAWDISTASFTRSFSVSAKENIPHDVTFKPDGTEMYIIGSNSDYVHQYTLSNAWDISTASFTRSFSVSAKESIPTGVTFKPDGAEMYIIGYNSDSVHQYTLSTAWNISTASFTRSFSISAKETDPTGVTFKSDGAEMYIFGDNSNSVHQYTLSTAWNISTASFTRSFSVSAKETNPTGVTFKSDGAEMYIIGKDSDSVNQYTLSTAWDISTASFTRSFSVSAKETDPTGVIFKPGGAEMYIVGHNSDSIHQYTLPTFVSADLTDGLKDYWKLDESSGTTMTGEISNDGTSSNVTVNQSGKIIKSYLFVSASSSYVGSFTENYHFERTQAFSVSFWIKTSTANGVICGNYSNGRGWQIELDNGKVWVSMYNTGTNAIYVNGGTSVNTNAWVNVIVTYDGSSTADGIKIYVNGELETNTVGLDNLSATIISTRPFEVGRYYNGSTYTGYYNGYLDELGIWEKELTSAEVSKLYNSGEGDSYPFLLTPTASVDTGTYNNNFSVTLDNNGVADIYYTTDGSDPDDTDTLYSGAISITGTTTLKAISWGSDVNKSDISSYTYTMVVADPSITVATGTYNNDFTTTITSATTTASIYYTTNGDTPDTGDTLYSGAISITGTTTLKAKAFQTGYTDSGTDSETYTMVIAGTPTADKDSGLYYDPFNVTLTKTGTTTGTKLTYTLNGDAPTITSAEYSAPLTISASLTLKFAEFKTGYTATSIVTKTYEVREPITNFYFYDENLFSAIATVTITDANGSTYTSDVNGLWTTSLSNVAKSFTISKTGYDTRDLDFYFKRQDANFNFMLSQDDNSSSINFLVRDANDNLWSNKYLMFVNDTNIITSVLTSATGTATANILPAGDYNALLYNATGDLNYTYAKTTVTVNKPKTEKTSALISPYDIYVSGLLQYSLTNKSASSVTFNVFAGTTEFYTFTAVDYNTVVADQKYIPKTYFVQVPMGNSYVNAITYQPYLLLKTDGVVPKVVVLDQLNRTIENAQIYVSKYVGDILTVVESGYTFSNGAFNFSAYPLDVYYLTVYYNGTDYGTFSVQPRESSDIFYIKIDRTTAEDITQALIIQTNLDATSRYQNRDTNINVLGTITSNFNYITDYNVNVYERGNLVYSSNTVATGISIDINKFVDVNLIPDYVHSAVIKIIVNYSIAGVTGSQTFSKNIMITDSPDVIGTIEDAQTEIGQPLSMFIALAVAIMLIAVLIFSGILTDPSILAVFGALVIGVFMMLGFLDIGVVVLGMDIGRFAYFLGLMATLYFALFGGR